MTPDDVYGEIADGLDMTGDFIDRLKELNIYDSSLIFIISDHGFLPIAKMKSLTDEQYRLLGPVSPSVYLGQYRPLLMVKPPYRDGALQYNDSAATIIDIRKTINDFLPIESKGAYIGVNLLDFADNPKERMVPAFRLLNDKAGSQLFLSTQYWEEITFKLPLDQYYLENSDQKFMQPLRDLSMLKSALAAYYKDHGAYPVSEGFGGLYSDWGYSGEDWIKGLTPNYLPKLPRDPRLSESPAEQYLYKSDGKDYKLILHNPDGTAFFKNIYPDMNDPARQGFAYGYWTAGGAQW